MTARETLLFGILVVVGVCSFRQESEWNQYRLGSLHARERQVAAVVRHLRQRQRDLRAESAALSTDPYYVERMVREQFGWRPPSGSVPAVSPDGVPTLGGSPGELARTMPSVDPTPPSPPSPPSPPPPPADPDRQLLADLGYRSVPHFQRKMMSGQASGDLDRATRQRARAMMALLKRVGYVSVREFQQAHRLTPDGIYGRRTERAVIRELRRAQGILVDTGRSGPRPDGG